MTAEEIMRQAQGKIEAEDHRLAVDRMKVVLQARRSRPLWQRLFPFTITIKRRD